MLSSTVSSNGVSGLLSNMILIGEDGESHGLRSIE